MKKFLLIVTMVIFCGSVYASENGGVVLDVLGHFSRQISSPTLNMAGGSVNAAYLFTPQLAAEVYFSMDMYSVVFTGGSEYSYKDFNYGAGGRFYLIPQLYIKFDFGRLYRRLSVSSASTSSSEWRYGGGIAYLVPLSAKMFINVGADVFRYSSSATNIIVANAGLTFGF